MAGLYVHIPFCKRKCHYCDFASIASNKYIEPFVEALLMEIEMQQSFFGSSNEVQTLYFGGGTPSILTTSQLEAILEKIHKYFNVSHNAEVTIELNPDDVSLDYVIQLKRLGYNRISLGTQSFIDAELQYLQRTHNAETSFRSVLLAKEAGFDNISIDIIFGLPAQIISNVEFQIEKISELDVQHVSAYSLTVEQGTALALNIKKGLTSELDDNISAMHYTAYMKSLQALGYIHYEVSSYAKPGFESKHNSGYWKHIPYLGLGTGAHSFIHKTRLWNTPFVTKYIEGVVMRKPYRESEVLSDTDLYNEFMLQRLRTNKGVCVDELEELFGRQKRDYAEQILNKELQAGNVMYEYPIFRLTDSGKLFADKVIANCMAENKRWEM